MVRIYPFNAFASSEGGARPREEDLKSINTAPNRFSESRSYDRSVLIDRESDDIGDGKGPGVQRLCAEAEIQRQTPVVVLSRGRGREKEHESTGNSLCSRHGITFRNVKEFIDGGILELVREQSFLIYSQETGSGGGHRQVGICAALAVEDCLKGSIKRHEKVTKEATVSQKRLSNASHPRNVDPVMMMYRYSEAVQAIIEKITARDIPVSMQARSRRGSRLGVPEDDDAVPVASADDHKIWSITDQADIEALRVAFSKVDSLYIADGHHRTAAACRTALLSKGKEGLRTPSHTKYLLGFLYPHTHMRVIPYNRCVTSLGEKSPEEFLRAVSSVFSITEQGSSSDSDGEEERSNGNGSSSHLLPLLEDTPPTSAPRSALSLQPPEAVLECSSSPLPGSPETSIVRGLVLSMDSESESDEDDSSSKMDEDEDSNSIGNSVANRFRRGSRSNSFGSYTSIESSLSAKSKAEKRQQLDAASRLELEIDTEDAADPSDVTSDAQGRLADTSSDHSATRKARRGPSNRLIGPRLPHTISMYFEGRWLDLSPLEAVEEKDGDPLSSLDIQVLFERLLRPLLGIECPRTDPRMIYVCGSEGMAGLETRVDSQTACVAFCVGRVSVQDIMRVADAGQLMPPKATCFSPKPLSGLLVRLH